VAAWLYCIAIGPALALNGALGLVLGGAELETGDDLPRHEFNFVFEFNGWHHVLHVLTGGLLALALVRRAWAPVLALAFGLVYAVLTPLGFIDGDDVANVVYSHTADNFVHATLAVLGLAIGVAALSRRRPGPPRGGRSTRPASAAPLP
jgi:hypothetical protein